MSRQTRTNRIRNLTRSDNEEIARRPLPFTSGATGVLAVAFAAELLHGLLTGRVQVAIVRQKVTVDLVSSPATYWLLIGMELFATLFFTVGAALLIRKLMRQPADEIGNHGSQHDESKKDSQENESL
jgi:hypothetical protein